MPKSLSFLRLLVLTRDGFGFAYMILLRTVWFGASWMLIIWRLYAGLGVAGRSFVKRVSTGRVRLIRT